MSTCGLHIHISRAPFGEDNVSKLIYLVHKHWPMFVKFSRRGAGDRLDRYARRYGGISSVKDADDRRRSLYPDHDSRYRCVNIVNPNTVEIRIFKGTLKPATLFAAIEFVDTLVKRIPTLSVQETEAISWGDLIVSNYPELNAYLADMDLLNAGLSATSPVDDGVAADAANSVPIRRVSRPTRPRSLSFENVSTNRCGPAGNPFHAEAIWNSFGLDTCETSDLGITGDGGASRMAHASSQDVLSFITHAQGERSTTGRSA